MADPIKPTKEEQRDIERFKEDVNKAVEKFLKKTELEAKDKKTDGDIAEIKKLGEGITELGKKIPPVSAAPIKFKSYHMYDAKKEACDKKDSGSCGSTVENGRFKCSAGQCKCKCHVYVTVAGQQFRAEGFIHDANFGDAPAIGSLFPLSCLCVK